ncbi:MAG TPA: ATP-binding protein [Desulforhopalus sp.]|nr:ATP-binding protein [Desulforhopalus sp.]
MNCLNQKSQNLRARAEAALQETKGSAEDPISKEYRQLLHELQVHQIELELQNEELRNSQNALEESRTRYMQLYHNAPVGYVVLNRVGIIKQANATFAEMVGKDGAAGAITGKPFVDFLVADDQRIFLARLKSFFKSPAEKQIEVRIGADTATQLIVSLAATQLQRLENASQQREDEIFVIVSDITERRQLEKQQQRLQTQVNQLAKAESLGRMAGAIAHNFNNMLAVVLGNLEILSDTIVDGQEAKCLRDSVQAAWKASELSRAMLTYLGSSAGEKETLDLAGLCARQVTWLMRAKPEQIATVTDLPEEGPLVLSNHEAVEQILSSLLVNAWEAIGEEAGTVRVAVYAVGPGKIAGRHRHPLDWRPSEPSYACIEVTDDGCGIAKGDMEKLFDPFFTTKFTGRGMGLSVVLGIVRAHDGVVVVSSRAGIGTTLRVYLPEHSVAGGFRRLPFRCLEDNDQDCR